jgi:hypothetical protein
MLGEDDSDSPSQTSGHDVQAQQIDEVQMNNVGPMPSNEGPERAGAFPPEGIEGLRLQEGPGIRVVRAESLRWGILEHEDTLPPPLREAT